MSNILRICLVSLALAVLFPMRTEAGEMSGNLLRNGSFEGGMRYWYNERESPDRAVVKEDAPSGSRVLRLEKGGIQSAAFKLMPNRPVTISFDARADKPMTVGWQCAPASREVAMKHNQTWSMKHHHPVEISTEWKRYSATFTPSAPQDGFWPEPTYLCFTAWRWRRPLAAGRRHRFLRPAE